MFTQYISEPTDDFIFESSQLGFLDADFGGADFNLNSYYS
jgi:hypothetical protein